MTNFRKWAVGLATAGVLVSGAAQATLVDRGGGLIYDTALNITWLQNSNLAATNTFGVSGINAIGTMNWATANAWIAAMNAATYLGYNDWRLPITIDSGTSGCNNSFNGTDCGYNVSTASEMAHLWYVDFQNKALYNTSGSGPQSGWGLVNNPLNPNDESLFTNLQSRSYWSGTVYAPSPASEAWYFNASVGYQGNVIQSTPLYAWAVRAGDVGASGAPEPAGLALALTGLGLLGLARRRRFFDASHA